eukprot:555663_1
MISMYISFSKSHLNGTFGKDIVILDPLEAKQIKILPLSMYFSCANGRLCGIIKQAYFYEYGYSIPFAVSNTGWFESVHLPLLINNDISTCFVGQKLRNFSLDTLLDSYEFAVFQPKKRNLYTFVQE